MGVNIYAYKNLKERYPFKRTENETYDLPDGYRVLPITEEQNENWPDRCLPFKENMVYSYDDTFEMFSRSYGKYMIFRMFLFALGGNKLNFRESFSNPGQIYPELPQWIEGYSPFFGMIAFSDCGGVIGTDACKSLYKDFLKFKDADFERVLRENHINICWLEDVDAWYKAFLRGTKIASRNGAIILS